MSMNPYAAEEKKTILGHPRGLFVLFFAEMWERFSYYGMRVLLVLYLTQHFLFGPAEAQGIYAAYAALVYLMPVVGGMIAEVLNALAQSPDGKAPLVEAAIKERVKALTDRFPIYQ